MARTKINVADTDGTIGGGGTGGTNLQVNSADLGTDALGVIAIKTTTPPSDCPTGTVQLYVAPIPSTTSGVPEMSSDTAPSGEAFASTYYYSCPPWWAYNSGQKGWITNGSDLPQYIGYKFDSPVVIIGYAIETWWFDNYPSRSPMNWQFQGSNNGTDWTTLHTVEGFVAWEYKVWHNFSCTASGSYLYYRLNITANLGNAYAGIGGLRLFPAGTVQGLYVKTETGTFLLSK